MHRRTMLTGAGLAGITAALPPELLAAQSQTQGNAFPPMRRRPARSRPRSTGSSSE
jgi:hypothetical protein